MTKVELSKTIAYWATGSKADFDSAKDIIQRTTRYSSGLFFLHLSVEKQLKANFMRKTGQFPPFTHNLTYLADRCELPLTPSHRKLLTTVNEFNLSTRYPTDKQKATKKFNKDYAQRWLKNVEKFLQFLAAS